MGSLTSMVNILGLVLQAATVISAIEGELKPDSGSSSGSSGSDTASRADKNKKNWEIGEK